jgi:hypothetical protein
MLSCGTRTPVDSLPSRGSTHCAQKYQGALDELLPVHIRDRIDSSIPDAPAQHLPPLKPRASLARSRPYRLRCPRIFRPPASRHALIPTVISRRPPSPEHRDLRGPTRESSEIFIPPCASAPSRELRVISTLHVICSAELVNARCDPRVPDSRRWTEKSPIADTRC